MSKRFPNLTIGKQNPYHIVMDPKASSQLDPKLQEAYNRVMGTPTSGSTPTDNTVPTPVPADPTSTTPPVLDPTMPNPIPSPTEPPTPPASNPPADNPLPPTPPTPVEPSMPSEPQMPPMPAAIDPTIPVNPPAAPEPEPAKSEVPVPSQPAMPQPTEEVVQTPTPAMNSMENTASVKPHAFVAKKGMKISPVILIVGGIAFLLVYTVVWVKVFNLSVPFINQ